MIHDLGVRLSRQFLKQLSTRFNGRFLKKVLWRLNGHHLNFILDHSEGYYHQLEKFRLGIPFLDYKLLTLQCNDYIVPSL